MKLLKNKKVRIILTSLLTLILIAGSSIAGYGYYQLNKVTVTEISKTDEDLGIVKPPVTAPEVEDEPQVEMDEDIVNIALFGSDRRSADERARTDTIMIATIDKKHKKIKLSSIMRDTYVKIDGHGMDKITHAYFYGGPQLAIKTINQNFKTDIRDYVLVDFFSLEKIIDALGGVTIDVRPEEIVYINSCISEVAKIGNVEPKRIKSPGTQVLNGAQAVAYGRIRKVGNGDYERTDRQRRVLTLLFDKVTQAGALKYPYLVSQILPYVETSIDKAAILKLGAQVFAGNMLNIEQERFPLTKASKDTKINGLYYLWADLKATAKHINQFIYDDVIPEVKAGDKIAQPPAASTTASNSKKNTSTKKNTSSTDKNKTGTKETTPVVDNTPKETTPVVDNTPKETTPSNGNSTNETTPKTESAPNTENTAPGTNTP